MDFVTTSKNNYERGLDRNNAHFPGGPALTNLTLYAAISLRSSWMTDAKASGLTPSSHNLTVMARVSESSPVSNSLDISLTAGGTGKKPGAELM